MSESKRIKGSDLIAPKFLQDSIEQATVFLKVIKETKKVIIDTNKATATKLKNSTGSDSKALKEQNALVEASIKQRKLALEVITSEIKAQTNLDRARKQAADFEKKKRADDEKAIKAIKAQNSAYAQASDRLNQLRKGYKDMAIEGKKNTEQAQLMLLAIQKLDKQLKEVDADVGQFNRSVGDYKNQMKEALTETGLFSEGLNKLGHQQNEIIAGFGAIVGQLKALKSGQDAAEKGASKLGKTLKAIGIVALIGALAAVFSFFTSSRKGALEFDLMLDRVKGTIDILIGSMAKLGKGLLGLGKAMGLFFSGEFKLAKKAAKDAMKEMDEAFDGNVQKIEDQTGAYMRLTLAIFETEDAIMKLSVALNQAKMDEEDFNEIAADNTISLNKQKAALEGAIGARLTAAKIQKEIAALEYKNAVRQIEIDLRHNGVSEKQIKLLEREGYQAFLNSKQTLDVTPEALKAIEEKFEAQEKAADALDDLDRQEAERRRQQKQTETIADIELIRSKKLGADEAVKILTKQVSDEKNQLADRERFEEELRAKQISAQNEEIRLLGAFGLKATEVNDLINEKDAVKLALALKNLRLTRLSQEATDELAKVILEAQTNDIAYQEQLAKFEDEKIKRKQKILQLDREIAIINEQSVLDDVNKIETERQKALEESNNKILQSNNVFNKKLIKQRQDAANSERAIVREEYKIREDLINKQYIIDQENIKNSVDDEKLRDKELEKLRANYLANLNKLENEKGTNSKEFVEKELAQARAIEQRKTEIVVEALNKATAALTSELDKRNDIRNQKADEEISNTQSQIDKQRDLAARGLANTLAFQEEQLAKDQLRQKDELKKQAREKEAIALAEALFNAYNAELKQPNSNPTSAAAKALADVLLFKGIAAGIVQFAADGNDDVQGPGTTKSDSIPFMLSKHEGVVKADANMNNPGVVSALNKDIFDKLYMPRYDLSENTAVGGGNGTAESINASLMLQNNSEIIGLLKEIKSKPVQQVDVGKLSELIETVYLDGMKTVTKYKNRRKIG